MFSLLAWMVASGKLDAAGLAQAVTLGWITQDQSDQITATDGQVGAFAGVNAAS